jgi:hypothetical protein
LPTFDPLQVSAHINSLPREVTYLSPKQRIRRKRQYTSPTAIVSSILQSQYFDFEKAHFALISAVKTLRRKINICVKIISILIFFPFMLQVSISPGEKRWSSVRRKQR